MNQKKSKRGERNKFHCDECDKILPESATNSFYRMSGLEICSYCCCEGRISMDSRTYKRDGEGNKTYF